MAYYGPMNEAVQYFIDMGWSPQNRQTSADFLVAVTDPAGRFVRDGFEQKVPKTASAFAEYFRNSEQGKKNAAEVKERASVNNDEHHKDFVASARAEKADHLKKSSPYVISYPSSLASRPLRKNCH